MSLLIALAVLLGICSEAHGQDAEPNIWPPYYELIKLRDIQGTDKDGELRQIPLGYTMHRDDLEKALGLKGKLDRCRQDRDMCEAREADRLSDPPFWDSTLGDVIQFGGGFLLGVGTTLAIVYAVQEATK